MKFSLNKGAPDIPLELIEAQETGNLLFFCGAGVSYSAGLPLFSGLVEAVYKKLGENKTELEEEAINAKLYDRALGLLESRVIGDKNPDINIVRKAIIEVLTLSNDANLENHRLILDLSKTDDRRYRLVTTNVDHGFKKAEPDLSIIIDSAPKLPVPKPHRWKSLVHLHGIISDHDPNGEQLIFTSGDFGAAYLTDRWASRFVTELFKHFTVLFVGYSVNDPVIRYITDAIAAERLRGYKAFRAPYVFTYARASEQSKVENSWRAIGIAPITYAYSHSNLYSSLKAWGDYVRDGLNAKARIVIKEAMIDPLPPYEQDDGVKRLVDVLREKKYSNSKDVTGYPAKVFSEMENPPAPISWLPVLYENNLLTIAEHKEYLFPVNLSPIEANLAKPNKISFNLWRWLLHHLENNNLIFWVIDKGVCLHPDLKYLIDNHIRKTPPKKPYLLFWKIVTSNFIFCGKRYRNHEGYNLLSRLKVGLNDLIIAEFSKIIEPFFKISKVFRPSENDNGETESAPFKVKVIIGISNSFFEDVKKADAYPKELVSLLMPATNALTTALKFFEFIGVDCQLHDRSHWDMVSISPHQQNRRFASWVILIELCRDLWAALWEEDNEQAKNVLKVWQSSKYVVFRRLSFHAMSISDVEEPSVTVDYLLEDNAWWLWAVPSHREVFRLLASLWPKLDQNDANKLTDAILKGPPRRMYRQDLSEDDWVYRLDRDVWLILAKLQSFGRDLPRKGSKKLKVLTKKYPNWKLREDERDEFTHWSEVGWGHKVDISPEELFDKETIQLVKYLSEKEEIYGEGRINLFRNHCKNNQKKCIDVLKYCKSMKIWNQNIWHAGLVGLAECADSSWHEIAPLLINIEPYFYQTEGWAIAHWTKNSASILPCDLHGEENFISIFNALFDSKQDYKKTNQINNAVDYAINHPIGIITEALLDRFGACKLKAGDNIPEGGLKNCLDRIIKEDTEASIPSKIILASRLHYLHALDSDWANENLIPLFRWDGSELAEIIWQGYLWSPRISIDLAKVIKIDLLNVIKNKDKLGDSSDRIIQLFAIVCLQYPDLFKAQEQREALIDIGADGLVEVAEFFRRSLAGDPESADNYWLNRLKPFMQRAWPKSSDFISDRLSEQFALMLIDLDDTFEQALNYLLPFIQPFPEIDSFLYRLHTKTLPDRKPKDVFKLISKTFTKNCEWPIKEFREVLNRIIDADPSIKNKKSYRSIDDYLIGCGFY